VIDMLYGILRSERGASAVELGLLAPFLLAMVVGMSDLGSAYSMKLRLEQAAQRSLELVQQEKSPADPANHDTIATEATNAATDAGYSGATVSVVYTNYCDGTATTNYTDGCTGTQVMMKYVNVTITSSYKPLFSNSYFPNHKADGTVTVTGQAGMRVL
jgi:Flp pilus assembly protein TadG